MLQFQELIRNLNQIHPDKLSNLIKKTMLGSMFLNVSVFFTDLKGPKEKYNVHYGLLEGSRLFRGRYLRIHTIKLFSSVIHDGFSGY